ncbi:rRNA N6-adenosine-methyltransferase ZCCHC4-like isoform X2 [Homarus americanus]|uniref:rRNA N6-adenosine-methyltransferase ZCCHC4-like isoform X2 n=1 Tax=Homarus americanus TaxID=6706 RepID=UPI001C4401AB|nr:rRNA N6-adenosine-methyltransferase ZCCHC4-like isoform X2 [Homarus americanus]
MANIGKLGVDVVINNIEDNPLCIHGPTLLFERFQSNGQSRQFYACSACRDRRDCAFFHWADQKITSSKKELWDQVVKESSPVRSHKERYKCLEDIKDLAAADRRYCTSCSTLLRKNERQDHNSCVLISPITNKHLCSPSTFLPPKESAKLEAQYLFASSSVDIIVGMLQNLKASRVVCVGAPRIHEAITNSPHLNMSSLMMDIDDRYCSFFSPERFIRYNMFNHHFFDGQKAKTMYQKFILGCENLVIVSDPPFGGRMELLAHNLNKIQEEWKKACGVHSQTQLPVLFIFPYFMEPQVISNLPNFTMLDYQVDYDNHPLYSSGPKGMKNGSAVRVFVNRPQSMFPLPESEGYHFCQPCDRWVSLNNKHCNECNGCMSKDGKTYKHCDLCKKCVKPSWIHCSKCSRCQPQDHKCHAQAGQVLTCHMCGRSGHKRKDCPKRKEEVDVEELVMSHEQELTPEDLQQLDEMLEADSGEEERESDDHMSTSDLKDVVHYWEKFRNLASRHPDVEEAELTLCDVEDTVVSFFKNQLMMRRRNAPQTKIGSFFTKRHRENDASPQPSTSRRRENVPAGESVSPEVPDIFMEGDSPSKKQ